MDYNCDDLLDNLHDAVYFVDRDRKIILWNKAAERLTGFDADEVLGTRCSDNILTHVDENGINLCSDGCPLVKAIDEGLSLEQKIFLNHKSGHRLPVMVRVTPLRDLAGNIVGAAEMFTDASPTELLEKRIEELTGLAFLDPLTRLSNRVHMESELEMIFNERSRYGLGFGLLFAEVDNFKAITASTGHAVGDQILKAVAGTLAGTARAFDLFGRWGEEKFVGIIRNINLDDLIKVGERCRLLVEKSYVYVDDSFLSATISIGATVPVPGDTMESIVKRAEGLMLKSRMQGMNCLSAG